MRKFIRPAIIAALSFALVSCGGKKKESTFDQYGISFTVPADWQVTDNEDYDETVFIAVEKTGLESSGLVTITTFPPDTDIEELIEIEKEALSDQGFFQDFVFEGPAKADYGSFKDCDLYNYSISIGMLDMNVEGRLYIIKGNDSYAFISEQEDVEDKGVNAGGFKTIADSFSLK